MPSIKRLLTPLVLLICLAGLAGCKTVPEIKTPEIVYVTVEKLPELTDKQKEALEDCPIAEPSNRTVGEAVAVARARKDSLKDCNVDKGLIRGWFGL